MTDNDYFNDLIIQFPSLKSKILDEDEEMIFMRMEIFADYTNEQIKQGNINELKNCFQFQETKIDFMSSSLKNALVVSYCEALLLGQNADEMEHVTHLMLPKLKSTYLDYKNWYNELANKNK